MTSILLTGASGFVGQHLRRRLLDDGHAVVTIDIQPDDFAHPNLTSNRGDIRDRPLMESLFVEHHFDAVIHCAAAVVAHAIRDRDFVQTTNVDGTQHIADLAGKYETEKVIFISTCCLWKHSLNRPVTELDDPDPGEVYGWSKEEGERILLAPQNPFTTIVLRSPTVVDSGRLGLFSILFEFIDEGRRVWVVGDGSNRHQFISARDLSDACARALTHPDGGIYNVGSDNVPSLRKVYETLIDVAGTPSRVARLPKRTAQLGMRTAYRLGISPLGPYQYRMIAEDFVFDTQKIKREMGWLPTSDNSTMLVDAYRFYRDNYAELHSRDDLSAHRQPVQMGVIRLLKWIS